MRISSGCLSLVCLCSLIAAAAAQPADTEANRKIVQRNYLTMPEPPLGFTTAKTPIITGDQFTGFQVEVSRPGVGGEILITITLESPQTNDEKIAAVQSYVAQAEQTMSALKFQVVKRNIPDLKTYDFSKPLFLDLEYKNDQGVTKFVRERIFFTSYTTVLMIVASKEEGLDLLTRWASSVKPIE
ncbi:hypothetical protein [Blastopirellula marina]|uniref:DUF1795 domain-containing protein n=1 Tax=Blastopirellula marina TaxID=124 RepID=A0A2S8GQR4_9BACT|nr:hypothetical protein [Blastopirellula marina]PQO35584.1 hypothetical protein C5Y98_13140 [Blastopirellula marina]PQO46778.1 hypothetical protein C5Y93_06390 [Blastopirellula marina]PTL44224.1 hypothetical protein C5Y97_13150 [Blastopirellula marina]